MLLLLKAWGSGDYDSPEWAVVSLTPSKIQVYLGRIDLARRISDTEHAAFHTIEYWDNMPVWVGYSEVWEELYPETAQIIEHLQAGNELGQPLGTECTMLVVTPEGVAWETTLKNSPGTVGTETVSSGMLRELRTLLLAESSEQTGQANRYPRR